MKPDKLSVARTGVLATCAATALLAVLPPRAAHAQILARNVTALTGELQTWYTKAQRHAPGKWGVVIADAKGEILWSVNPNNPLIPASTVKLFTTGFARSVLGSGARSPTRFLASGELAPVTGELLGPWALELNGDPTLDRGEGQGATLYELAQQLADQGVRRLRGPLTVRTSDGGIADAQYPSVWSPHHRGRIFAPLIGPLMLHENVVWVTVVPGGRVGARPRVVGDGPEGLASIVTVSATTVAGRRGRLGLRPNGKGGWSVVGKIGIRSGGRMLKAVAYDPKAVLNAAWASALRRAGIVWLQDPVPTIGTTAQPHVLAEVSSAVLDSVASEVNRRSLNVGAEALLHWAAGRDEAAVKLTDFVRTITGDDQVHLVDGSGLSYDDRASPAAFVQYLAKFPQTDAGKNFPMLLPANGEGTLRRMNRGLPAAGVVRAKTGTLGQVATVSGYLGRPDGVLLISLM